MRRNSGNDLLLRAIEQQTDASGQAFCRKQDHQAISSSGRLAENAHFFSRRTALPGPFRFIRKLKRVHFGILNSRYREFDIACAEDGLDKFANNQIVRATSG
jgi:hypothetical protein